MIAVVVLGVLGLAGSEVSVRTLLPQMWDWTYLTRPACPSFTMAQASSYDRASNPGPHQDWFANNDNGQFVRTEVNAGRTEAVMADLKGPGAVVRLWSANPNGTIRFYFDGETKPRIQETMEPLFTGQIPPFKEPFGYIAGRGANIYFPFPYAKSLKITVEGSKGLYYHVGYRTYAPGTSVETYDPAKLASAQTEMRTAAEHLVQDQPAQTGKQQYGITLKAAPAAKVSLFSVDKPGTVTELDLRVPSPTARLPKSDPNNLENVLRNLLIEIDFDGERCVEAPVGDFFGTSPGLNLLHSMPFQVESDGTLTCRLPMPFHKQARVWLTNLGAGEIPISARLRVDGQAPARDAYHFHSQWTAQYERTRPMRDMEFLNVHGEGYWIGSNLNIGSPAPDWWGEGDEKAFVDNDTFPSTFGTGSEDYYGYAWGSSQLFERPYHAQTRCDGPDSFGHTNVHRWQLFDPIPYTKALRFYLEMWHWKDCKCYFARTVYWYAKPGGTGPATVDRSLLPAPAFELPKPIEGAIEGENLTIVEHHGGALEPQGGFFDLSNGKQLWWHGAQPKDRIVLRVPVKEAGEYEVVGNFCQAPDYGIHKMRFNGQEIDAIDFYGESLSWQKHTLGTFTLPKGDVLLEVECIGNRRGASPGNMFGLDYLLLNKK